MTSASTESLTPIAFRYVDSLYVMYTSDFSTMSVTMPVQMYMLHSDATKMGTRNSTWASAEKLLHIAAISTQASAATAMGRLVWRMSMAAPSWEKAAYENLGQAGCDGEIIIYCTGATVEYFDSKGIYWASVCSEIIDQDIIQMACASDYYCGNICEVDEQAGYDMAQGMYDAGCRYIAYLAPTAGMNTCHDERVRGIERFLDDHPDVELATSWRGSPFATGVQEVLAAYPDIDGLMSTGGDTAIPAAIYAAGMEKTCKYACVDIQEGVYDQLKDGVCVWVAGGQYPTAQLGFALVYNGLTGHKIMPDLATTMHRPYMYIKSAEDYENYMKYMEGSIPAYTGDEIKDLCAVYNKEASDEKLGELLQSYCDNYTMEDLLKRHGDLNIE